MTRLRDAGLLGAAGLRAADLADAATRAAASLDDGDASGAVVVLSTEGLRAHDLAPLLTYQGHEGFVVSDMQDADDFTPIPESTPPDCAAYLLVGIDRGDRFANMTPNETLPEILTAARSPLTISEGIQWLLHSPAMLERGKCFMTIGSRLRKPNGALDARTPAVWISNGTGRDGRARKNAPKLGWCWAGNRHTWLGMASTRARIPLPLPRTHERDTAATTESPLLM